jgi:hypothetical protein
VVNDRFNQTEEFTANALASDHHLYSPIASMHWMAEKYNLPTDAAFWESYNNNMLSLAKQMWVLTLPGWETSKGVTQEIEFFLSINERKNLWYVEGSR